MILEPRKAKTSQPVNWIIILWSLIFCGLPTPREQYINTYKDLAIIEMHRKGIPASIKLAQAILESQSGTSSFASNTNNHFGIKCKSTWGGEKYYHKDDDLNQKGELIPSCFRSYDRVVDSYVDHSNFLAEREYYTQLWLISTTDYKACLLYTSPSPRDATLSRMPSSA